MKRNHIFKIFAVFCILVLFTVLVAECGGGGEKTELERSRDMWEEQKITSYRYQVRIMAFAPEDITSPVKVEVREGATQSVTYAESGAAATAGIFNRVNTIDKLFDVVQEAVDTGADEVLVTYDPTHYFPTRIEIDREERAIDDEITYEVSGFERVE